MLIVIPKNKLESIDSVTPLLREIYQKKQIKIEVVIFSYKNFKQIKKNVFLFDTIKSFGKIKFVERENFLKFTNKILKFLTLINFMIKGAIGYKFLHFGYLEAGPFKIIGILFKKNVFMCQTNSYSDIRVDLKFNL